MTNAGPGSDARSFSTRVVPWLVAAGALLVYSLTLNPWLSILNFGQVMHAFGVGSRPEIAQPLTSLAFYPFRWLPVTWIAPAMNLFTAVCAALVLGFLARSVALLPHDLAPATPSRKDKPLAILATPTAWMPPVLTALLCGLQLSFWEHATSASGWMIDLLVFAYVIRCLLEFRIQRDQSWLSRSAFVYAAGMANDWVMVAYLPLFLIAVLRAKGLRECFNRRFLVRMSLWASAGLGFYLLLPLVRSLPSHGDMSFWTALGRELKFQASALAGLRSPEMKVLALTSLLPLLLISVRWRSHTAQAGDDSPLGIFMIRATGHLAHGLFLAISLWMALDPTISPRHLRIGSPLLHCYYLSALVFGYCVGYFLLLKPRGPMQRFAGLPVAAGWILLCILPAALLARNLGQIRITNGPALHEYARQLYADLPPGRSVALSREGWQLPLLRAELTAHPHDKDPILLNTALLPLVRYRIQMATRYQSRWPAVPAPTNSPPNATARQIRALITAFAKREPIVGFQPNFGFLMEPFQDEPRGLAHRLVLPPNTNALPRNLDATIVATNELIWEQRWTNSLKSLADHSITAPGSLSPLPHSLLRLLRLNPEKNYTALLLDTTYSRALDVLGVQLQRQGRWRAAGLWFDRALKLNPRNTSAQINLLYNQQHRKGDPARLKFVSVRKQFQNLFAGYKDWGAVLIQNGPVDEPTFLNWTARAQLYSGNARQAQNAFLRSSQLAPDWPPPRLGTAWIWVKERKFDQALHETDAVRKSTNQMKPAGLADFLYCRASALRGLGRTNEATALIMDMVRQHRDLNQVLVVAARLYAKSRDFARELDVFDELLKLNPDRALLLEKKGLVEALLLRFNDATATLSQALSIAPADHQARLYRAFASLCNGHLENARADYQALLNVGHYRQRALFGLGEVARREQHTNEAIRFYKEFVAQCNTNIPQYAYAMKWLNRLQPPPPSP